MYNSSAPRPGPDWSPSDFLSLGLFACGLSLFIVGIFARDPQAQSVGALVTGFGLGLLCDRAAA